MKRLFDVVMAGAGCLLLAPVMLVIAVVIRAVDGSPVLFRQVRIGRWGRPFTILKFRTMTTAPGGPQVTVHGDSRVTRLGGVLRSSKLDELPQLWNVVRGDMSLVGPRPEVPRYVEGYTAEQRKVLDVRPGITDPVSVMLVDESSLLARAPEPETYYTATLLPWKLSVNLEYLSRATLASDVRVILQTLRRIAPRRATDEPVLTVGGSS